MVVKPGAVKRIFAPYKGDRLSTLSWEPPPTPPGVRKRKAAEMAAAAFVSQPPATQQPAMPQQQQEAPQHDESSALPGPPIRGHGTESSPPAAAQLHSEEEKEKGEQAEVLDSSSDEGVVDFMSDDDNHDQNHADDSKATAYAHNSALSRFDDSEEEGLQLQQALQQKLADAAAAAAARTSAATDLSRFDDSDDESQSQAGTVATAANLSKLHDNDSDDQQQLPQQVTCSKQKWQTHADALCQQPAVSMAAAAELASCDDSDAGGVEEVPRVVAQPVTLSLKAKAPASVINVGSATSPTPEALSQPPTLLPSSSPSDAPSPLSSQQDTSSDEAGMHDNSNLQNLDDDMGLPRHSQLQQQHFMLPLKLMSDRRQWQQSLGEPSDAHSDSEVDLDSMGDVNTEVDSEAGSHHGQAESSDESGARPSRRGLDYSGSKQQGELSSEDPEASPGMHTTLSDHAMPASQQLQGLQDSASEECEDSMQAEVEQGCPPTNAFTEGLREDDDAVVIEPGSSGAANPEMHSDAAHLYPGDVHAQICACRLHSGILCCTQDSAKSRQACTGP